MISPKLARLELVLVVLVSLLVLAPGIGSYSLVDPWETHYGEVARMMLQNNDWVHTQWPGSLGGSFEENEGFRSKPVLQFWMMAAGMRAVSDSSGVTADPKPAHCSEPIASRPSWMRSRTRPPCSWYRSGCACR